MFLLKLEVPMPGSGASSAHKPINKKDYKICEDGDCYC